MIRREWEKLKIKGKATVIYRRNWHGMKDEVLIGECRKVKNKLEMGFGLFAKKFISYKAIKSITK